MSNDPFRKLNEVERGIKRAANAPQQELRGGQQQMNQAMRAPEQAARRAKYNALSPVRQLQAQKRSWASQGRRYKRYGKRMSGTDFTISAMMYPTGFLALIGGFIEDWDTEYIRWHLVHARMLWATMLIFTITIIGIPIAALLWFYGWFLGFQAYSGKQPTIPVLTNFAGKRGWLDLEPVDQQ